MLKLFGEDGLEFGVLVNGTRNGGIFVAEGVKVSDQLFFRPFATDSPSGRNLRPFNEAVDDFYEGLD